MRIVIVTDQYPPLVGGVSTVTRNLSVDLAARGHQVWVIAPSERTRDMRLVEEGVHIYRFSSFKWPAYEGMRIAFLPIVPLRHLLNKIMPDVVHIHSPVVLGNLARMISHALHRPVIATNHFMPINISRALSDDPLLSKSFESLTYSYLIRFYNHCNFVTAPTVTALEMLRRHGLRVPSLAISNGINLARFRPAPPSPELRQTFRLPEHIPLVLFVGRLFGEKRINVLIDAISRIPCDIHLAIAGTGPEADTLQSQVTALGLEHQVTFLGFVPDAQLPELYHTADIFAIPSIAELQSLATMEAMASGLPVVAANCAALPELVRHGENGFLTVPESSSDLADKLLILLRNPELRQTMGQRSLEIIAAHDREQVLRQWEQLYEHVTHQYQQEVEREHSWQRRRLSALLARRQHRYRNLPMLPASDRQGS
jgi:glycosyltransferase involved in cell wall biosynthesis